MYGHIYYNETLCINLLITNYRLYAGNQWGIINRRSGVNDRQNFSLCNLSLNLASGTGLANANARASDACVGHLKS